MMDAIQIGRVANKRSPVVATEAHTWPDFAELLTRHTVQPGKDGPGWVPGPVQPGSRTAARVPGWCVLALDIEAPAEAIPDTEHVPPRIHKRLTGPDVAPAIDDVAVDLELLGWAGVGYTSYSHQEPALTVDGEVGTLGPRYRLVLPLSRMVKPDEIRPLGLHVLGVLGLAHVADVACLEPARLFYFPSCPPERENLAQARIVDGEPLDVSRLLQEASAAAAPARKTQSNTPSASVIEAFNNGADVGQLLERHGYKRKGRNRWMWPGSTTGMAGVYLVPGTQRVVSRHSNDPLHADGKSNDAFGVWCELEHGGDYKKAVRAASKMLGMERNRNGNGTEHPPACSAVPLEVDPDTGEILGGLEPGQYRDSFEGVPLVPPTFPTMPDAPPVGFEFVPVGALLTSPAPVEYLVDELIEHPSMGLVFGPPGAGKSFATLAMAASVATGTPWLGRDVKQGAVFYLAGEGHAGIGRRLKGWAMHHGVELANAPLYVSKVPAALMDKASAIAVEAAISAMTKATGTSPAMLVIDTLARNMGDGDENSNADIGRFIHHIDALRLRLGCTVVVVHHTGHQDTGRARGGSALNAAMDVSFLVDGLSVTQTKTKEGANAAPIGIELHGVELPPEWKDNKGRVLQTAVVVASGVKFVERKKPLSPSAQTGMDAYHLAAQKAGQACDSTGTVSVHLDDWRAAFYEISTADEQSAKKVAFQRARTWLVNAGKLTVSNDRYTAI